MTNPQWTEWAEHQDGINSVTGEVTQLEDGETLFANGMFHVTRKILQPEKGIEESIYKSVMNKKNYTLSIFKKDSHGFKIPK